MFVSAMMTSENQAKTNEFLRRRKLRIQQVREQSKDIAKKVRQRAKSEKLRNLNLIDAQKEKDTLLRQEQLVRELEEICSQRIHDFGAGHRIASEVKLPDNLENKVDLSKKRGKAAATLLRQQQQEKLDKQKLLLDRRLQAREVANELSREKSKTITNQLQVPVSAPCIGKSNVMSDGCRDVETNNNADAGKTDMATQWENECGQNEEPSVPKLLLPNDDDIENVSVKLDDKKKDNYKKLDLFAVSEDMPFGIRVERPERNEHDKPALTLVSEYLQQRNLHLRESGNIMKKSNFSLGRPESSKRSSDDYHKIKETILNSKATSAVQKGSKAFGVHDSLVYSVSKGQPHTKGHSLGSMSLAQSPVSPVAGRKASCRRKNSPSDSRGSPSRRSKMGSPSTIAEMLPNSATSNMNKKVTVYNHATRDSRYVPVTEDNIRKCNLDESEDAYSLAMKESKLQPLKESHDEEKKHHKMRSKVAMTKQNVEKEYKETMEFLKTLPQDKSKPNKYAYMSEDRLKQEKEKQQKGLQHEYKKARVAHRKLIPSTDINDIMDRPRSASPRKKVEKQLYKYNWMPVPESDASLAIHTIPTTSKTSNMGRVKFAANDYHEYRSQHKHTPPTKEQAKKIVMHSDQDEYTSPDTESDVFHIYDKDVPDSIKNRKGHVFMCEIVKGHKRTGASSGKRTSTQEARSSKESDTNLDEKVIQGHYDESASDNENGGSCKKPTSKTHSTLVPEEVPETVKEKSLHNRPASHVDSSIYSLISEAAMKEKKRHKPHCQKHKSKGTQIAETSDKEKGDVARTTSPSSDSDNKKDQKDSKDNFKIPSNIQKTKMVEEKNSSGDNGFIQLLGTSDKGPGKFYIGATGPLNDNTYEVVIQVKKKDGLGGNNVEMVGNKVEKSNVANVAVEDINTKAEYPQCPPISNKSAINNIPPENNVSHEGEKQVSPEVKTALISESQPITDVSAEKQPVLPVRSASTCTQTSFASPMPIPLFHMSSSTSTTYLSPPDKILPKLLKSELEKKLNQMSETDEETPSKTLKDIAAIVTDTEINRNIQSVFKRTQTVQTLTVPPNTRRSDSDTQTKISDKKILYTNVRKKYARMRCCQCRHCGVSKKKSNTHCRHTDAETKYREAKNIPTIKSSKMKSNSNLDPVVKDYVNTLLTLSKDRLRSVEIINQDCSTVTTPGSSVVGMDGNINKRAVNNNIISLEQTNRMFQKQRESHKNLNVKYCVPSKKKCKTKHVHMRHKKTSDYVPYNYEKLANKLKTTNRKSETKTDKILLSGSGEDNNLIQGVSNSSTDVINERHRSNYESQQKIIYKPRPLVQRQSKPQHSAWTQKTSIAVPDMQNGSEKLLTDWNKFVDTDSKIMRLAEQKLENIEKIASLTDKCTQRLSGLTKILEEVRKNKTMAYSQKSTSETSSDTDRRMKRTSRNTSIEQNNRNINSDRKFRTDPQKVDSLRNMNSEHESENINTSKKDILPPTVLSENTTLDYSKRRPPPALLTRVNIKDYKEETMVPHELSTVVEVDSPMSLNIKSQLKRNDNKTNSSHENNVVKNTDIAPSAESTSKVINGRGDAKIELMNLKMFNNIMFQPFPSVEEFAKHCHGVQFDSASHLKADSKSKEVDEMSSLHSEESLSNILSELLKRKPIKSFEYGVEINASHFSTGSSTPFTVSRLSNDDLKCSDQNNEHATESSDILSNSSNRNLENAFKINGLGWASSTLKKTKERLALPSTSNSSTSSLSNGVTNIKNPLICNKSKNHEDMNRSVQQQTSITKAMTVQEFLDLALEKKITFNRSHKNETDPEFISLYETKMPEEMKKSFNEKERNCADNSSVNRARTSTPVQIYKASMYHSSSTSNNASNGLFSNVEDLSSVKVTSGSIKNNSTSEKDDLTIPNCSLKMKRSDVSKSE